MCFCIPRRSDKSGYEIKKRVWSESLSRFGVTFVVIAIVLSFGGTILDDIKDDQTSGDADYNATAYGLEAIETFASWLPTLALIVVAAVIIGIIIRYFMIGGY